MRFFLVKPAEQVCGRIFPPGDKSIAHRSVIISALSRQKVSILNFPSNKDCLFTVNSLRKLGIKILRESESSIGALRIAVYGKGLYGLKKPSSPIFVGDSGTTLRLLLGVLAGQGFKVKLTAGGSLSKRPMLRVTAPLRLMGARINAMRNTKYAIQEEYPPIVIKGGNLKPISYKMPVASAQVKSAIILAGLFAKGKSCVIEPIITRDHTERMLKLFSADIKVSGKKIFIKGGKELVSPRTIYVPGDISSASFFLVLAAILPNSELIVRNVSLNPSRTGIIKVLKRMGADIRVQSSQSAVHSNLEPMGDLIVKSSHLRGTEVKKEEIPLLIDELPILMVAASCAEGKTVFEGVGELRVKETDRIDSMSINLGKMGVPIQVVKTNQSENVVVRGTKELKGAKVKSYGDHRTAMSMVVAGLRAKGNTLVDDISCIDKSFPNFLKIVKKIT